MTDNRTTDRVDHSPRVRDAIDELMRKKDAADNRTTELLRKGLTERGIEWRGGLEGVTFVGDWCFVEYDNGKLAATCEPTLTPEQAMAVTLDKPTHEDAIKGLEVDIWRSCEHLTTANNGEILVNVPWEKLREWFAIAATLGRKELERENSKLEHKMSNMETKLLKAQKRIDELITAATLGDEIPKKCSTCQYRYVVGQRPYPTFGYMCGFGDGKKLCGDNTSVLDHMGCEHWEKELR